MRRPPPSRLCAAASGGISNLSMATAQTIMRRFRAEPCVIVSESFARRHRLRDGESIELTTPEGAARFRSPGSFTITRAIKESFT